MFSLHSILEGKPDHPMFDVQEARKLLADLPKNDAFKALDEITSWLTTVNDTVGFRPEVRTEIIMLLDETGRPLYAEMLHQYLGSPHLQDFQGLHQWQGIHDFIRALAEAYATCIAVYQQAERKPWDMRENLPVICTRLLRAVAEQMKLKMLRYIEVGPSAWEQLCSCYSFAEANQISESMVYAYPKQTIHTSPQRELLRAVMLYVSSPDTLAPDQIEVSYRIAGRLVSSFDFKPVSDPDCAYFIDLSKPSAPGTVDDKLQIRPSMRFFGAVRAVPKIQGIIEQNERGLIQREQRFGNEFTPAGKLTVLKHLQTYWGKDHPYRHQERKAISATIEVVHDFQMISQLVACIDIDRMSSLSEKDATALKERSKINLAAVEDVRYTTETWTVSDISINGIGGILPRTTGTWIKIGALCGLKSQSGQPWWVGMIRRFHTDSKGMVHVGIEILAKKPLAVWLRALGKGTEKTSNWETSSGSFEYDYLPVILLPDAYNSYVNATMLMESGSYAPDNIFEMMMGEKSRDIKLTGLLAEGENYEQVSFQWLNSAHT